jgi:hypothetical protein
MNRTAKVTIGTLSILLMLAVGWAVRGEHGAQAQAQLTQTRMRQALGVAGETEQGDDARLLKGNLTLPCISAPPSSMSTTDTGVMGSGFVLMLGLLVAVYRRLGGFPLSVWTVVQRERARSEPRVLDAMAEAVASKSGQAIIAVHAYQEQIAESLRAQVADAETRARVAERRAADAGTTLSAAADLVRELHRSLEAARILTRELRELRVISPKEPTARPAPLPSVSAADTESDDGDRTTTEVPGAPPGSARSDAEEPGFDEQDENTRVANRPATLPDARANGVSALRVNIPLGADCVAVQVGAAVLDRDGGPAR